MTDGPAFAERTDPEALASRIPGGFQLGVSSSAYQIEGAAHEGGRGPSGWDVFAAEPGRIIDGSNADRAVDHYHRLDEDVRLIQRLGVDCYRFSVSWSRIQPEGRGAGNREGLAFYDRLLDRLLAADIRPMATLFHWDAPEALAASGGWYNRDTAGRFADYALMLAEHFGDRIESWITINEPATVMIQGHMLGTHAPGSAHLFAALPTAHHQLLGHGLAVQALRSVGVAGRIGIANVHSPVLPAGDSEDDRVLAALFDVLHNRIFADAVLLGRYPEAPEPFGPLLSALAGVAAADLAVIGAPLDFYGLNYAFPTVIRAGAPAEVSARTGIAARAMPFSQVPLPEEARTGSGWPKPGYLTTALTELAERYGERLPPIVITENGASFDDPLVDGAVDDRRRIDYLAGHLEAALRGVPGVDVQGYVIRSLLDGFEWSAGFSQRFGLVHVDPDSLERTPKASYHWLARMTAAR